VWGRCLTASHRTKRPVSVRSTRPLAVHLRRSAEHAAIVWLESAGRRRFRFHRRSASRVAVMRIVQGAFARKSTVVRVVSCGAMGRVVVLLEQSVSLRAQICSAHLTPTNAPMRRAQPPTNAEAMRPAKMDAVRKPAKAMPSVPQDLFVKIKLVQKPNPQTSVSLAIAISPVSPEPLAKPLPKGRSVRLRAERERAAFPTDRLGRLVRLVWQEPLASTTSV
jgi:hypothetical protein